MWSVMSETILRIQQRYSDPYNALLIDHHDEDAWHQIFGEHLQTKVCTVMIRERGMMSYYGNHKNYKIKTEGRRQCLAYC